VFATAQKRSALCAFGIQSRFFILFRFIAFCFIALLPSSEGFSFYCVSLHFLFELCWYRIKIFNLHFVGEQYSLRLLRMTQLKHCATKAKNIIMFEIKY